MNIVYINFRGAEHVSYINKEIGLILDDIYVSDAGLTNAEIHDVLSILNGNQDGILFLGSNDDLAPGSYSTIYVGENHGFDSVGPGIQGISEISGNTTADTTFANAFVLIQNISNQKELIDTIRHEAGHLTKNLTHDFNFNGLDISDFMATSASRMVLTEDTTIVDKIFADNTVSTEGAAIFYGGEECLYAIIGSTFSGNESSTSKGGAIQNTEHGTANIRYSLFESNTAFSNGGAINDDNGTIDVMNSTFSHNTAKDGGAIFENHSLRIDDVDLSYNTAEEYGGAIYLENGSATNATFQGNTANKGGAIFINGCGTITDSLFTSNAASTGGAIFHANNNTTEKTLITGSTFSNNSATRGAAAYNNQDALLELDNCIFIGNIEPDNHGAALFNSGTTTVRDCEFKTETDSIYNDYSSLIEFSGTVKVGANLTNNGTISCSAQGATLHFLNNSAIYVSGEGTLSDNINLVFSGNSPVYFDGGFQFSRVQSITIHCDIPETIQSKVCIVLSGAALEDLTGKTITINGDTGIIGSAFSRYQVQYTISHELKIDFISTPVVSANGLINEVYVNSIPYIGNSFSNISDAFESADTIAVTGCTFTNGYTIASEKKLAAVDLEFCNCNASTGGAIYNNGKLDMERVIFHNNTATSFGGALHNSSNSYIYANGCTFTNNNASRGAGFYSYATSDLTGCTFMNNTASQQGGAISFMNIAIGTSSINGCIFNGNSSRIGSAIYLRDSELIVEGSTFTGNTASSAGKCGAIYASSTKPLSIIQSTFSNNIGNQQGGAVYIENTTATMDGLLFSGNTASTGGAVYIGGSSNSSNITLIGCTFETSTDTIYIANPNATITMEDTISIGANIYSAAAINCATASLRFIQNDNISIDASLNSVQAITFCGDGAVIFNEQIQQDFSNTSISIFTTNDSSTVIATGDFLFDEEQIFTINGYSAILNEENDTGYTVSYNTTNHQLKLLYNSEELPRTDGKIQGDTLRERIESTKSCTINFGTAESSTGLSELGTGTLNAGADKHLIGGGSTVTDVTATLFGNGHNIIAENITWNGYIFGNGLSQSSGSGSVTLQGDTQVKNVCGGGYFTTPNGLYLQTKTSITINENATGSSNLLCAGNYVGANATELGETHLTIHNNTTITNTAGYVMGGSLVSNDADYTFYGNSYVDIASGYFERVYGSGVIQSVDATYTHMGDINLVMTGGTVNNILFGGIGSNYAAYGTKTVDGNINIKIDSSQNSIGLFTVFGGCNGAATITKDITITFTGLGSNLEFKEGQSGVLGDNASNEQGRVQGKRALFFDSFQGDFGAKVVKKFDEISFVNGSNVIFTQARDLSAIHNWNFDADSSLEWNNLYNNDFTGDDLCFGSAESVQSGTEFTFLTVNDENGLSGFEDFGKVLLFGEEADFDGEKWVTTEYEMAQISDSINNQYSLLVSRIG